MDRQDLEAAWPLTDPTLRLVLAQDWVWNHRHELAGRDAVFADHPAGAADNDWEGIARGLAECPSTHPLWDRLAADVIAQWQRVWRGFSARTWGISGQPEVLALDLEMVTFVEAGTKPAAIHPGHYAFARRFAMAHADGRWTVASINGDQLFRPGWPPTLGRPSGQL